MSPPKSTNMGAFGLDGYYSRKSQKGAKEHQDNERKDLEIYVYLEAMSSDSGFQPMRADDFRRIHWRDTTANEGRKALVEA